MATLLCSLLLPMHGRAQSRLDAWMSTGAGQLVAVQNSPLTSSPAPGTAPRLALTVGFVTAESPEGEGIRDQFTLILQDATRTLNLAVASLDARGARFFPQLPGYLPADTRAATWNPTPVTPPQGMPPSDAPPATYRIEFALPSELIDQPLSLRLTLFDNQDELNSAGWVGEAAWVPEPGPILPLFAAGIAGLLLARRRPSQPRAP